MSKRSKAALKMIDDHIDQCHAIMNTDSGDPLMNAAKNRIGRELMTSFLKERAAEAQKIGAKKR